MVMLLGKKVGMTRVYGDDGKISTVTVIQAGPCKVMQIKSKDTDGYSAVQLGYDVISGYNQVMITGYDDVKKSRVKKPAEGHAEKANTTPKRFVREMRTKDGDESEYSAGDDVLVEAFADVKSVDVVGTSKGKGFAGGMKRHGFGGFPASHGTERKHRAPGSISSYGSDAGHGGNLKKGKKMAGRMGGERVTTKHHENNLLIVEGAVAGPDGGYVEVCDSKTAKIKK